MTTTQLLDVFSVSEITQLSKILDKLPNKPNSGGEFFAYKNGFQPTDFIYSAIHALVIKKSDNFPLVGISQKLALVIFTTSSLDD
jgi:hypothetical protein